MDRFLKLEVVPFKGGEEWEANLEQVLEIVNRRPEGWVVFPEVALTGFSYDRWEEMNRFGKWAVERLKRGVKRPLVITIVEEGVNNFYFIAPDFCYRRPKFKLFGRERKWFKVGKRPELFSYNGVRAVPLICFELRFIEYWLQFRHKADLFLIPSLWGRERIGHFQNLLKSLALSTQSWVVAVNGGAEKEWGAVIDGWGEGVTGSLPFLTEIDLLKNRHYRRKLILE